MKNYFDVNIIDLFLKTNILVQISILILIGFSIISWSVFLHRIYILYMSKKKFKRFEKKFWSGIELSRLYEDITIHRNQLDSTEHIFYVGFEEFSKLYQIKNCSSEIIISRTLRAMHNTMNLELEILEEYIPLIGTIGSTSPYIGLFGTILGIIHVFVELGKMTTNITINQTIHMQVIAPGISEALISTAIGLFVAIPAVIAFNYLNVQINRLNQNYSNFIEEFITILYRQTISVDDSQLNQEN